jgi:hypothetical protein
MKEYYKVFEVTALRNFPNDRVYVGSKVFACRVPSGCVYLSKEGTIGTGKIGILFCINAIEDVDFKV